jgi:hypothetical protein
MRPHRHLFPVRHLFRLESPATCASRRDSNSSNATEGGRRREAGKSVGRAEGADESETGVGTAVVKRKLSTSGTNREEKEGSMSRYDLDSGENTENDCKRSGDIQKVRGEESRDKACFEMTVKTESTKEVSSSKRDGEGEGDDTQQRVIEWVGPSTMTTSTKPIKTPHHPLFPLQRCAASTALLCCRPSPKKLCRKWRVRPSERWPSRGTVNQPNK